MPKQKIRQIVRDAFVVNELVYQFNVIDREDGLLTSDDTILEVNEKYSDKYIINEALNRLDIAMSNLTDPWSALGPADIREYERDARQLTRFLSKYDGFK